MSSSPMIGRRVAAVRPGLGSCSQEEAEIIKWEPLGSAMCDVLVRHKDGYECWHGSHGLTPIDELGPLPSRKEAQDAAQRETRDSLRAIRDEHIREFNKPWPGLEFGKVIVGNAINRAWRETDR